MSCPQMTNEVSRFQGLKPLIKDTPKGDKPPNKGQAESTLVYTLYRKSPVKEDYLFTKDKTAGPEGVLINNGKN